MVVQQHVLNWLYSVLTSEYRDVNRAYNDVAQALSAYPSLSPRTDVHTFDTGASALLVHLTGTVPVVFRGTTYRFPVDLWLPHAYPREPPLVYVVPTDQMLVRPGQHVDPQGRVYHPYLAGWVEFWDKSSILDFLAILRDVFAKEPPVVARQQSRPAPPAPEQSTATPPPLPPLPAELSRTPAPVQSPSSALADKPPPPPPKGSDGPQVVPGQPINARDGPPLPPLPHELQRQQQQQQQQHGAQTPQSNRHSRYDSAPPLPPQANQPQDPQAYRQPPGPPYHPQQHQQQPPPPQQQQPPYHPQHQQGAPPAGFQGIPPQHTGPPTGAYPDGGPSRASYAGPPLNWQQQQQPPGPPPPHAQPPAHAAPPPPPQPVQKPPPPPDIMDEPLTLALPSPSRVAPPPIPMNPEKDALLRQLGATLHAHRQRAREQNASSRAGLTAQRNAMLAALQNLQADAAALAPLSALLASNTAILQSSVVEADGVVARARDHPPPPMDDLLVAPTVVGNQLYDVVAEERALGDAIFVLGRAVERGRVAPAVFAKTVRSLAREQYLKKALARKIGRGMGLVG